MRVAKEAPVTCADSIVIFLVLDPIVVPMVRNHLEPTSFMDLSMPGARKQSAKKTVSQGYQGETKFAHTLDDSGLKKEIEQRIAKLEIKFNNLFHLLLFTFIISKFYTIGCF